MAGTRTGGLKARDVNLKRNPNHYKEIGRIGGSVSVNGGFAAEVIGSDGLSGRQRARKSGSVGGKISKRGPGFKYRYNGKVYKIKELAELFGVTYETARQKVKRLELEKVQ